MPKSKLYTFKNISGHNFTVGNKSGVDRTFKWENGEGEIHYDINKNERDEIYRKRQIGKNMENHITGGSLVELGKGTKGEFKVISGLSNDGEEVVGYGDKKIKEISELSYEDLELKVKDINVVSILRKLETQFAVSDELSPRCLLLIQKKIKEVEVDEKERTSAPI